MNKPIIDLQAPLSNYGGLKRLQSYRLRLARTIPLSNYGGSKTNAHPESIVDEYYAPAK